MDEKPKRKVIVIGAVVGILALGGVEFYTISNLNAVESKLAQAKARQLDGLKQSTTDNTTTIAAVTNEVRGVREDVASTRGQLSATISDLRRVSGDLGLMSGLIATNGKEIEALKQLGDRNYAEFTVYKTKSAARVGDVWVLLKAADSGRNRYTIELQANDRKIEKKDRALNEPVQFYVGQNRQPHELVVNRILKNAIVGYLATPRSSAVR